MWFSCYCGKAFVNITSLLSQQDVYCPPKDKYFGIFKKDLFIFCSPHLIDPVPHISDSSIWESLIQRNN